MISAHQLSFIFSDVAELLFIALPSDDTGCFLDYCLKLSLHCDFAVTVRVEVCIYNISHCVIARFGHQDKITDIDVLSQERVVTSGARDGSIRIWKIVEESQLVFHGHRSVIVCCLFYPIFLQN